MVGRNAADDAKDRDDMNEIAYLLEQLMTTPLDVIHVEHAGLPPSQQFLQHCLLSIVATFAPC